MFVQTEETPNPSTLKFMPGIDVMGKGKTMAFANKKDSKASPLAENLFKNKNIRGVFFGSDFITITKTDDLEWKVLKTEILSIIIDFFIAGGNIVSKKQKKSKKPKKEDDSFIVQQIKELLEERVRPAVAMDGGDIIFHKYENGIVYLEMQGACSGCPSSAVTLKQGVENMLKHFIPEIESVENINEEEEF